MKILRNKDRQNAVHYLNIAILVASNARCTRAKCGAVIVNNNKVIGSGFNSPPLELENQRRCFLPKNVYDKKVTDKTCCIHAEQRAIIDTLKKNQDLIIGSSLYFARLDINNKFQFSGLPYCTICSKLSLEIGIRNFILWHKDDIISYKTMEYNELSFSYDKSKE